jgi:hypothetical protein
LFANFLLPQHKGNSAMQIQMSPQIDKLAPALTRVQAKLHAVTKNANNPYFKSKYADLSAVIEESKPILEAEGLALTQWPCGGVGNSISLANLLLHESGQWLYSEFTFESKDPSPQGKGGCITYMRRYGQLAILNMGTEDDDGNKASGKDQPPQKPVINYSKPVSSFEPPTPTAGYIVPFGKFKGKDINSIPLDELKGYVDFLYKSKGTEPLSPGAQKFVDEVAKLTAIKTVMNDIPPPGDFDVPF